MAVPKFETKPEVQALIHIGKVALFIIIAGGLTGLVDNVGKLNLSPEMAMVLTGVINLFLAGFKKYKDVK